MPALEFTVNDWNVVLAEHVRRRTDNKGDPGGARKVVRVHLPKERGRRPDTRGLLNTNNTSNASSSCSLPGKSEVVAHELLDAHAVECLNRIMDERGAEHRCTMFSLPFDAITNACKRSSQHKGVSSSAHTPIQRVELIHSPFVPTHNVHVQCAVCRKFESSVLLRPFPTPYGRLIFFHHGCEPKELVC